jgi:hypothetical protein
VTVWLCAAACWCLVALLVAVAAGGAARLGADGVDELADYEAALQEEQAIRRARAVLAGAREEGR